MIPRLNCRTTNNAIDNRDKSLIDVDAWNVRSLRIERGNETVVLSKAEDGWKLQSPVAAPADGPMITDLINEFDRLRATSFLVEDPDGEDFVRVGLDRPTARLTIKEDGWETGKTVCSYRG